MLEVLAQALQGAELGDAHGQLGLGFFHAHLRILVRQHALGFFLRLAHLRLVDVRRAHGGVRQYGDDLRLHFEDAAGDGEVQLLAAGQRHHHLARLQAGDQRRVLGRDAQLAQLTGSHDQGGVATEDLLLGTDDVATDGAHGTLFA